MKRPYPYTGPAGNSAATAAGAYPQQPNQNQTQAQTQQPPLPAGPAPNQAQTQAFANYGYGAPNPAAANTASMSASEAQQAQWHQQWQQYYAQQAAAQQQQQAAAQGQNRAQGVVAQAPQAQPYPYNATAPGGMAPQQQHHNHHHPQPPPPPQQQQQQQQVGQQGFYHYPQTPQQQPSVATPMAQPISFGYQQPPPPGFNAQQAGPQHQQQHQQQQTFFGQPPAQASTIATGGHHPNKRQRFDAQANVPYTGMAQPQAPGYNAQTQQAQQQFFGTGGPGAAAGMASSSLPNTPVQTFGWPGPNAGAGAAGHGAGMAGMGRGGSPAGRGGRGGLGGAHTGLSPMGGAKMGQNSLIKTVGPPTLNLAKNFRTASVSGPIVVGGGGGGRGGAPTGPSNLPTGGGGRAEAPWAGSSNRPGGIPSAPVGMNRRGSPATTSLGGNTSRRGGMSNGHDRSGYTNPERGGRPSGPASSSRGGGNSFGSRNASGGFSAQNSIPVNAPNGPAASRERDPNRAKAGGAAAVARGSTMASAPFDLGSKVPAVAAKSAHSLPDSAVPANSKRTFTDFRINGLRIDGIGWSWSVLDHVAGGGGQEGEEGASQDGTIKGEKEEEEEQGDKKGKGEKSVKNGKESGAEKVKAPAGASTKKVKDVVVARSNKPASSVAGALASSSSSVAAREASRLRICFAAPPNAGPEGAPTGPRADKSKAAAAKSEGGAKQVAPSEVTKGAAQGPLGKNAVEEKVKVDTEAVEPSSSPEKKEVGKADSKEAATKVEEEGKASGDGPTVVVDEDATGKVSAEEVPIVATQIKVEEGEEVGSTIKKAPDVAEVAGNSTGELPKKQEASVAALKIENFGPGAAEIRLSEQGDSADGERKEDATESGPANEVLKREEEEETSKQSEPESNKPAGGLDGGITETKDAAAPRQEPVVVMADDDEWTPFSKGPPQSSTNRVSISYACSKRRLVIDAEVIKSLKVFREERRIEIIVSVTTAAGLKRRDQMEKKGQEWVICKGVLLETRERDQDNFSAISRRQLENAWLSLAKEGGEAPSAKKGEEEEEEEGPKKEEEEKEEEKEEASEGKAEEKKDEGLSCISGPYVELPPLFRLLPNHDGPEEEGKVYAGQGSEEMLIVVDLDKQSTMAEAKWLRNGDIDDWLSALQGYGQRPHEQIWHGKLEVVDPDPPPTIHTVLETWSVKSFLGSCRERRRFIADTFMDGKGLVEILGRLVRGERSGGGGGGGASASTRSLTAGPLFQAASETAFASHQTHVSLAVLSLYALADEYAVSAGVPKQEVAKRVGQILLGLPKHLVFKALDGLWKEAMERSRMMMSSGVGTMTGKRKRNSTTAVTQAVQGSNAASLSSTSASSSKMARTGSSAANANANGGSDDATSSVGGGREREEEDDDDDDEEDEEEDGDEEDEEMRDQEQEEDHDIDGDGEEQEQQGQNDDDD
ncbi:hypothetical protein IE53DRAFT_409391 [Violaceomyces palustris]|uniref:Uncharacterized protein n=1 Tax=Violaceomyces palustris TaxID=1673888 RepID=A0ACD0P322_9BASI|nr:hypothetical protein IE53DRAFT_409391 [Violaceomyces palustris]